jgi:hypothetical protein
MRISPADVDDAMFLIPPKPPDIEIVNSLAAISCSGINNGRPSLAHISRERSNSVKRKAEAAAADTAAKSIRLIGSVDSLVSLTQGNQASLEEVLSDLNDEDKTADTDPLVVATMLKLSKCILAQNNVLATILADMESIKTTVSEVVCVQIRQSDSASASISAFPAFQPLQSGANDNRYSDNSSRRPLRQAPLGGGLVSDTPWTEVIKRRNQQWWASIFCSRIDIDSSIF